jgi:hypothetical protein
MILLQSYKYVAFSPEVTKIKVCNALRIFVKRFEKQLLLYLEAVVQSEIEQIKEREKEKGKEEETEEAKGGIEKKVSDDGEDVSMEVIEKVSVEFYIKHLALLNEIFKETINRFLGYLHTLVTEYE